MNVFLKKRRLAFVFACVANFTVLIVPVWVQKEVIIMCDVSLLSSKPLCLADVACPRFVGELQDLAVEEGDRAHFTIHVQGSPSPTVRWYVHSSSTHSSTRAQISSQSM
jgi:hypothetical protein